MSKKLAGGLFVGMLGAGLYAAYQMMSDQKKNQLKNNLKDKAMDVKERAIDYAFYASDVVEDLKDAINDQISPMKSDFANKSEDVKNKIKQYSNDSVNEIVDTKSQFASAKDRLKMEMQAAEHNHTNVEKMEEDIVVNADEALKNAHKDQKTPKKVTEPKTTTSKAKSEDDISPILK